jgi:hypothetical protein
MFPQELCGTPQSSCGVSQRSCGITDGDLRDSARRKGWTKCPPFAGQITFCPQAEATVNQVSSPCGT